MKLILAAVLLVLVPASADAGVVSVDGTTLRYAGGDADDDRIAIDRNTNDIVVVNNGAGDMPFSNGTGCNAPVGGVITCPGVAPGLTRVLAEGGGGNDNFGFSDLGAILAEAELGPGFDSVNPVDQAAPFRMVVRGGAGADYLLGGMLNDSLDGGGGEDSLDGAGGPDDLRGGADLDDVSYESGVHNGGVQVTLDDVADDGRPGEQDNAHSDLEGVYGTEEADVLVGNGAANLLVGNDGNDRLEGGGATDLLFGDAVGVQAETGDDTILARDGLTDYVSCGTGTDTLESDEIDEAGGCETENAVPLPPPPAPADGDGDGFAANRECDDARADVFPGAAEILANDRDEDCDGRDVPQVAFRSRNGATTRFKALAVKGVLAGDEVRLTGRPKRCGVKSRTLTAKASGSIKLVKRLPRRLRAGCVVQIVVTRAGRSVTYTLTTRKGKKPLLARL